MNYKQGYQDRTKGFCRNLSNASTQQLKDYSLGWLDAWKDEGYKKTQLGNMPIKQVMI